MSLPDYLMQIQADQFLKFYEKNLTRNLKEAFEFWTNSKDFNQKDRNAIFEKVRGFLIKKKILVKRVVDKEQLINDFGIQCERIMEGGIIRQCENEIINAIRG